MINTQNQSDWSPLVDIASRLLRQCEQAGLLAIVTDDWTEEFFINHIAGHTSVLRILLHGLQELSPLEIEDSNRPYLFQSNLSSDQNPPGGYCKWMPELEPTSYMESLIGAWAYQIEQKKNDGTHWLPLRGALWVTANYGPQEGIRYLFSLAEHGWLIYKDALSVSLRILIRTACLGGSQEEIVSRCFSKLPTTWKEWHEQKIILSSSIFECDGEHSDESILEVLVSIALDSAQKAKSASPYDSWLMLHLSLCPILQTVINAVNDVCPSPSVTLKVVLDQLEEAVADSGSTARMISSNMFRTPLIHSFENAEFLVRMLKGKVGSGWKLRAKERPLIPENIIGFIETGNLDIMPDNWKFISAEFAWVLTTCFRRDMPTSIIRSCNISRDGVFDSIHWPPLLISLLGNNINYDFENAILNLVTNYHSPKKISPFLKNIKELAQCIPRRDASYHQNEKQDGELSNAVEEWLNKNKEVIHAAISNFMIEYWSTEIIWYINTALKIQNEDPYSALNILSEGVKNYPWCEFMHSEYSIINDTNGDPLQAIKSISNALYLRSDMHMFWVSLGVIMHRQGYLIHGNIAHIIGDYLSTV